MPGDLIFIIAGILPFLWITWLGVRYRIKSTTYDVPEEALFIVEQPEPEVLGASAGPPPRYGSDRRTDDPGSSPASSEGVP